jgi:hypothetical protein
LQPISAPADGATPEISANANPPRPTITFETVTFSDGQTLRFDDDEIIVFVGPNNAGKSAALRELRHWVTRNSAQNVVTAATFRQVGDGASLCAYLEKNAQKGGDAGNIVYVGMGFQIHHSNVGWFDNPTDRHPVAPFFSVLIGTEDRLTASNPAGGIALYKEPPSHPIHRLLTDETLAGEISSFFRRAFNRT